jgi:hypothetical protein
MKKVLMFCFILFIIVAINVTAHSPSSMSINYNTESEELIVTINHVVSDTTIHYIYNITIEKNNEFYKSFDYINQPSTSSFTYTYNDIVAEAGDMFSVVARCNQGGQISKSLTVGSSSQDNETPGFEIIFVLVAITLILFWQRKRN